jgi:hypothetical protein
VGRIFERVPGAILDAHVEPGTVLRIEVEIAFEAAGERWTHVGTAVADAEGRVRLRVPYATDVGTGDGRPTGPLRWTLGDRSGDLDVPETSVRSGGTLSLD